MQEGQSLNYLRQFPIDCIKIDQSFVRDLVYGIPVSPIIHAIIGIARVETTYQMEMLSEIGCKEMQGYLFSRPVPAAEAERMLGIVSLPSPFRDAYNLSPEYKPSMFISPGIQIPVAKCANI